MTSIVSFCFRNPKDTEYYRELSDEGYYIYQHSLHQLSLAILLTIQTPDPSYEFLLAEGDRTRGLDLIAKLKSDPTKVHVSAFHAFLLPILYARDMQNDGKDYSKWNEPLEGFMALHNLQDDGNFKPPHLVPQLFAQLHYHIRGAMLYEGIRRIDDFGKNVYRWDALL